MDKFAHEYTDESQHNAKTFPLFQTRVFFQPNWSLHLEILFIDQETPKFIFTSMWMVTDLRGILSNLMDACIIKLERKHSVATNLWHTCISPLMKLNGIILFVVMMCEMMIQHVKHVKSLHVLFHQSGTNTVDLAFNHCYSNLSLFNFQHKHLDLLIYLISTNTSNNGFDACYTHLQVHSINWTGHLTAPPHRSKVTQTYLHFICISVCLSNVYHARENHTRITLPLIRYIWQNYRRCFRICISFIDVCVDVIFLSHRLRLFSVDHGINWVRDAIRIDSRHNFL